MARLFGYGLTSNFDHPYLATSINDFWNRWHISFTSWLREYIFFPLRRFFLRQHRSNSQFLSLLIPPLVTMLISGIWHSIQPTFIAWGLYHGLLLFVNVVVLKNKKEDAHKQRWLKRIFTFGLVSLGWTLFRSASFADAVMLVQSIFVKSTTFHDLLQDIASMDLILALISIPLVMIAETILHDRQKTWMEMAPALRWVAYFVVLISICLVGAYQPWNTEFIYAGF